jgi:hypothetical protein
LHEVGIMSTSLIILIPVMLLGIVGLFCFVGCVLPEYTLTPPFTSYSATTILANSPDCIAYWPLKEAKDTDAASELISNNAGNYIDPATAPTLYPWPAYSLPNGSGPDVLSAAAPGDIQLAQPTIVAGDVDLRPGDPVLPACMVVNGAYVEVPWKDKFIPKTSFTVEAWARVDWTADDPHAWRFVLDMREFSPATTGFALYARADDNLPGSYRWGAIVGDGSGDFKTLDSDELTITLKDPAAAAGTTFYVAATYEAGSQTLTLFVNGQQHGQLASVAYMPNTTQPLWIGAASPFVARRPQPNGTAGSPLFPFVGAIQDVAIYQAVLPPGTILTHFHNGSGTAE